MCVGGICGVCVCVTYVLLYSNFLYESNSVPNNSLSVDQIPHNQSYIHTG